MPFIAVHPHKGSGKLNRRYSRALAQTLDICVRYTVLEDPDIIPNWMTISIPHIIPFLSDLSKGLCNTATAKLHKHDLDRIPRKIPRKIPTNFNILDNSFPFVCLDDQPCIPFYSSQPSFFTGYLSSACVGSILYCVGGDSDDIVDGLQEIDDDYPPTPPRPVYDDWGDIPSVWENWTGSDQTNNLVKAKPGSGGGGGICHKIWYGDISKPDSGWKEGKRLISPRLYPHLVSYQGKLYAFGGNRPSEPFAEVYDPKSETWTLLEAAPFGRLCFREFIVVPLKGWDRLWVFSLRRNNIDYTYDVLTGKWQKLECAKDIIPLIYRPTERSSIASRLTSKKRMVIYWISYKGEVYAYNLSTKVLYTGTINGFPVQEEMHVTLSHLYRDIFCLIACEMTSTGAHEVIIHITLIRISLTPFPGQVSRKYPRRKPLSAAVLACFAYPFHNYINITGAYIMASQVT